MAPHVDITIPSTTISGTSTPYTIYNIALRLPLRSYTLQKRYSDFLALHTGLTEQAGSPPPITPPAKSWFSRTVSNPELTEQRRQGLEKYLQTINQSDDVRWRNTSVWRTFLNLPSSFISAASSKDPTYSSALAGSRGANEPITDPTLWLDTQRDVKTQLHDARLMLTTRDQAATAQKQHEAGAAAKASMVKAGVSIKALEDGLVQAQKKGPNGGWGSAGSLGEGEIRRRRDLITAAKKDRDGLEKLMSAMATKTSLDAAVASAQEKQNLVGNSSSRPKTGGRVLGKETNETRERDNAGLLQLQKQKMADQDLDVDELTKIIQRQKELGVQINEELEVQSEMLKRTDEDVDRVQGKINVAKRRIGKIS